MQQIKYLPHVASGICACQLREGAGWCRAGGGDDRETAAEQIIYFKKKAGLESISQFWENWLNESELHIDFLNQRPDYK